MTVSAPTTYIRLRPWIIVAIAWVVAFDLAWTWQRLAGAHASELGGNRIEAQHYMTGLVLRDFALTTPHSSPRAFVGKYVAHYPNVDLHFDPPLFHAIEGAWMIVGGTSRSSVMIMMAAIAATAATVVFASLVTEFGLSFAILGGLSVLMLPLVRESYVTLMPELLAGALILGAALSWGRYLEREQWSDAISFAVLATLGVLTDKTGWALLLQVPFSVLLAGKPKLLVRAATWVAVSAAIFVAGPIVWYLSQRGAERGYSLFFGWSITQLREGMIFYPGRFGMALGVVLVIIFALGVVRQLRHRQSHPRTWIAMFGSLVFGVLILFAIPAPPEARYLVPLLPIAVMFTIAGLFGLARSDSKPNPDSSPNPVLSSKQIAAAWVVGVVGLATAHWLSGLDYQKRFNGYADAATQVLESPSSDSRPAIQRIIVSSDAAGEGALISEIAMREQRPGHLVKRANFDLVRVDRIRGGKHSRFETSEDAATWFSRSNISLLALDQSIADEDRSEVHDQLIHATEDHPEIFWPLAQIPITRSGRETPGKLTIFRIKSPAGN